MKEFHWLPKEIDEIPNKVADIIMLMMGVYNRVQNAEIERVNKSVKRK